MELSLSGAPSGDRPSGDRVTLGLERPEIFGILPVPLGNQLPGRASARKGRATAPTAEKVEADPLCELWVSASYALCPVSVSSPVK